MSKRRTWTRLVVITAGLAMIQLGATAQQDPGRTSVVVDPRIAEAIDRDGTAPVIVGLNVDVAERRLDAPAFAVQREMIRRTQDAVTDALAGSNHRLRRRYANFPSMSLDADANTVARLQASPAVRSISLSDEFAPALTETPAIANFASTFEAGAGGSGAAIAIADTGVDRYHRFLKGAVVWEACFTVNEKCPNGRDVQLGHGSAKPCDMDGCEHGTHVAGIAAGRGAVNAHGVAPAANLIPIQVFSRKRCTVKVFGQEFTYDCLRSSEDDIISALDYVYDLEYPRRYRFAAVNLSLGSTDTYDSQSACDLSNWDLSYAIRGVHSLGVAVVAAAGNDGDKDALTRPACITEAIGVGSTTKSDMVASDSNSAPFLDLLAPGRDITSSVPGGGFESMSGTSMAAPHVAGAWAVLKAAAPEADVDQILAALRETGKSITDGNGISVPRIDVGRALDRIGTIRIEDAIGVEGSSAPFRVTLARRYASTVSVFYRTVNGVATAPGDFVARSGRLDFQPGETAKTISVPIVDDSYREGAQTFSVELYSSWGARRNRPIATGTIPANDNILYPTPPPYEGDGGVKR